VDALSDPNVAFLLFVLALTGLVFELVHPGLHLPGVVGLVLLVISVAVLATLPVRVTGPLLLAAAFVCFVVDVKVGAHGVLSGPGLVAFILGGLWLYDSGHIRVSRPLLIGVTAALGVFFVTSLWAALRSRNAPVVSGTDRMLGARATVTVALDPEGEVRLRGERWAATVAGISAAEVPVGAIVRVLAIQGLTLVVAPMWPVSARAERGSNK
jgi:membrane-bound serine protease (ClpP class)